MLTSVTLPHDTLAAAFEPARAFRAQENEGCGGLVRIVDAEPEE